MPKEILVIFHKGSNFDYHFIIEDQQKSLKKKLVVSEKILKNTKPLQFQKERS